MQRLRTLALALLATAALAACGDDGPTGPKVSAGNFKGTVTGSLTRSINGLAYFGSDVDPEASGFGIGFFSDTDFIFVGRDNPARPAVGTYALADVSGETVPTADQFGALASFETGDAGNELSFFSTGGQLKITTSNAATVAGTFTMTGKCLGCGASGGDLTMQLTGTFNAITVPGTMRASTAFQIQQARVLSHR